MPRCTVKASISRGSKRVGAFTFDCVDDATFRGDGSSIVTSPASSSRT
jgi:hypothetical protein